MPTSLSARRSWLSGILLVVFGCSQGRSSSRFAELPDKILPNPSHRLFLEVSWHEVWRIGGLSAADTSVINPAMVRIAGRMTLIYDFGVQRILFIDDHGQVIARVGRSGAGPGEFRRVTDFAVGQANSVVLLDQENSRVTQIDSAGQIISEAQVVLAGFAMGVVPLDDQTAIVVTGEADTSIQTINFQGQRLRSQAFPWAGGADIPLIARQATIASDGQGHWIYAYLLAGAWFPFTAERFGGFIGSTVDRREFPVVEHEQSGTVMSEHLSKYTPCVTCDAAVDGGRVYLLNGATDSTQKAVLDVFAFASGAYLGSYRLPQRARFFAVRDSRIVLGVEDPYPAVVAYDIHADSTLSH